MLFTIGACITLSLVAGINAKLAPRLDKASSTQQQPDILDYFTDVCYPDASPMTNSTEETAPCTLYSNVIVSCDHAVNFTDAANFTMAQEQACFCATPWADFFQGCTDCANAHGLSALIEPIDSAALTSWTSSYCAATATQYFDDALNSAFPVTSSINLSRLPTTWTDPIGNKTAISLYYTATNTATTTSYGGPVTSGATSSAAAVSAKSGQGVSSSTAATSATSGQGVSSAASASVAAQSTSSSSGFAAIVTPASNRLALAGVVGVGFVGAVLAL